MSQNDFAAAGLPSSPPQMAVLDVSGTLTQQQVNALQSKIAQTPAAKIKIVVLPRDFHVDDFGSFARSLAHQWHVGGDRMLIVVDTNGHHVRALTGTRLQSEGISAADLNNSIIPQQFVPYMKQGDLYGALEHMVGGIQSHLNTSATQLVPSTGVPATSPYVPQHATTHGGGLATVFWCIVLLVMLASVWSFFSGRKKAEKETQLLAGEYKERVGQLYEEADQIGQSSEYLQTDQNQELAQRVATFFNRLTTLQQAQSEVEALERKRDFGKARDGYKKLLRMISLVEPESQQLKTDVFALTGGVDHSAPKPKNLAAEAEEQARREQAGQVIQIPQQQPQLQYMRPSWTYEPTYYQPMMGPNLGGLLGLGMLLEQMETNRRLSDLEYGRHGGGWFGGGGWNDTNSGGGGDWGGSTGGGNDSGAWGDSGSGGGFDGGGFSDSGGSWDSGGGGDFGGGGGGDW